MKRVPLVAISALLAALAAATPARADDDRTTELERKVDALTREIEQMKLGSVADTVRPAPRFGLGPAAAKVYGVPHGVSIGGYGEALYQGFDGERQDGKPAGLSNRADMLRAVLYVGHKFSDELLLNSEIEIEHGGVLDRADVAVDTSTGRGKAELSGEVAVEFAYLDWSRSPALGFRAGKILVPLGLVNEVHEPPVFFGARRPEVEMRIIPSTWSALGAGIFGETAHGLSYRAYLMEGLDAAGFGAATGIRGGRQKGARSLATRAAFTARLDWRGVPGLLLGGSIYGGDTWQRAQPAGGGLKPVLTLYDVHARLEWRGLEMRGLYAGGDLRDAAQLSNALGLSGTARLAREFFGGYVEGAYDVMPHAYPGSSMAFLPYIRYEELDTQEGVAAPGKDDPANHRTVVTVGAAFKPHPDVVLKMDRQRRRNAARTEVSQWNFALGYLF